MIALKSLATVRKSASAMNPEVMRKMEKVTYGDIVGYEELLSLRSEGVDYEALSFAGMMPSGRSVAFFCCYRSGKVRTHPSNAD